MPSEPKAPYSDRQEREIDFHSQFAKSNAGRQSQPANLDVIQSQTRRKYNAFWATYDIIISHNLAGKKVLIPGCGFGEDLLRLAELGADVSGFDLSPDILEITRQRVKRFGRGTIAIDQMPCEKLTYSDNSFDVVIFIDILHHVDIPASMAEIKRVLKPGGRIIGNELYTHSFLENNIRQSWVVNTLFYPAMRTFIYGDDKPYITEDEHKIDEVEFFEVEKITDTLRVEYFNTIIGRLVPDRFPMISKLDRFITKALGPAGKYAGSRVVFDGCIAG